MLSKQTPLDSSVVEALLIPPRSWISVKETVPMENGMYVVAFDRWPEVIAPYIMGRGFILDNTDAIGLEDKITYWMPIPKYPRR